MPVIIQVGTETGLDNFQRPPSENISMILLFHGTRQGYYILNKWFYEKKQKMHNQNWPLTPKIKKTATYYKIDINTDTLKLAQNKCNLLIPYQKIISS